MSRQKRFILQRNEDETGISGTGIIAEGVQHTNGKCSMSWLTKPGSICVYSCIDDVVAIHGHGGLTEVIWVDK